MQKKAIIPTPIGFNAIIDAIINVLAITFVNFNFFIIIISFKKYKKEYPLQILNYYLFSYSLTNL